MRIVAVKSKLPDVAALKKSLADIDFLFFPAIHEHDRVFVPTGFTHDPYPMSMVLRSTAADSKSAPTSSMIFRRYIPEKEFLLTHITEVKNYEDAAQILQQLGFTLRAEVTKHREICPFDSHTSIIHDHVPGLGDFIKIEAKLKADQDPKALRDDLVATLGVLRLDPALITPHSYASLMKEKKEKKS